MRRLLPLVAGLAVAAAALAQLALGEPSAAHPCTLISNKDVARIIGPGGHVEVGGSTCRVHRGKPMVGVITINPDTKGKFLTLRRQLFAQSRRAENVSGIGQFSFQALVCDCSSVPLSLRAREREPARGGLLQGHVHGGTGTTDSEDRGARHLT